MTAGDAAMVMQVGTVFDVHLNKADTAAVFATIATPVIGSKIAHSILDFIPVVGWAAKSVVALAVTKAVGEALIAYFYDCSPLPEN